MILRLNLAQPTVLHHNRGLRGACHRAPIRAARWLNPGYVMTIERGRFARTP
jgi:hypothetical protein